MCMCVCFYGVVLGLEVLSGEGKGLTWLTGAGGGI